MAPPEPAHGRKLVIGCVALVKARIGKEIFPAANDARNRIEQLVIEDRFCGSAPFSWVGVIIREGLKNDLGPEIGKIDPKYGDLELAIEVDTHELLGATKQEMQWVLERATLRALVGAGHKFDRPMAALENELATLENMKNG